MKRFSLPIICLSFAVFPCSVLASSVVINEVMFNPAGDDTAGEWVELYNSSDQDADVSGWQLYPDGTGYGTIPNGFLIGAKKFVLIHLRSAGNNSPTDIYQTSASSNMSNTSGSAALFSAEPRGKDTIKSFLQWGRAGETWESSAADAGIWEKGTFVDLSSFAEGNSLALLQDGVVGGGKNAWRISNTPSPRAANTGASASNSPVPSPSFSVSPMPTTEPSSAPLPSSIPHASSPVKTIKAYAGEDTSSMVGALLAFLGRAKGFNDESLDNVARFSWNFGDGEMQEGRSITHIYRIPGIYRAGVQVSSGEYTASDYITIRVIPNLVSIADVVLGSEGYIRLVNGSNVEADISGWHIQDNKNALFIVPFHTKIAQHADIALSNSVTGLLKENDFPLRVFYPNGTSAFVYERTHVATDTPVVLQERMSSESPGTPLGVHQQIEKQKPITISEHTEIANASPNASPQSKTEQKELASVGLDHWFISPHFLIALAVSLLGAIGFLISKRFS